MTTNADELVAAYLDRLARASADLPVSYREELLEQISDHIAAARCDGQTDGTAQIRQVLDDLGDPAEVAAAAREQAGVAVSAAPAAEFGRHLFGVGTWRESAAVVLLSIGWVFVGLGWLIGLVLAWTSPRWSRAEKWAATGLLVPALAGFILAHKLAIGGVGVLIVIVGVTVSLAIGDRLIQRAHDRTAG
jgi:uncharacterized membrane protein